MLVGMEMTEASPNPDDWTDIAGAAALLGRSRATVYELIDRGVLTRHEVGCHALLWVPEVRHVAGAIRTLTVHRQAVRS